MRRIALIFLVTSSASAADIADLPERTCGPDVPPPCFLEFMVPPTALDRLSAADRLACIREAEIVRHNSAWASVEVQGLRVEESLRRCAARKRMTAGKR